MTDREQAFRQRLFQTFQAEAREHLRAIADGLVALEAEPAGPPERLEAVFRQAHSLKGAARAVDLGEAVALCQALEGVFSAWKRGALSPRPELFDLLQQAVDAVQRLALPAEGAGTGPAAGDLVRRLTAALEGDSAPVPAAPPPPAAAPAAAPVAASASPAPEETVRVAIGRLEALRVRAEELVSTRLALAEHVAGLEGLGAELAAGRARPGALRDGLRWLAGVAATDAGAAAPARALLTHLEAQEGSLRTLAAALDRVCRELAGDLRDASRAVDDLNDAARSALLLPVAGLLEGMPKAVRDLCRDLGKEAELAVRGAEVEIDRAILEALRPALLHLVRNALDHGIEGPAERERRGKPRRGRVGVAVQRRADGRVELAVSDDG
ncbi:MAG: Hpt domain-containing protein, partial [Deferrisomatales bacterium]